MSKSQKKSIKIVTLVDGKEVTVGRCHPGQARILRKKGVADWKGGILLLHDMAPPETAHPEFVGFHTVEIKSSSTLDIGGFIREETAHLQPDWSDWKPPECVTYESLSDWVEVLKVCRAAQHDLDAYKGWGLSSEFGFHDNDTYLLHVINSGLLLGTTVEDFDLIDFEGWTGEPCIDTVLNALSYYINGAKPDVATLPSVEELRNTLWKDGETSYAPRIDGFWPGHDLSYCKSDSWAKDGNWNLAALEEATELASPTLPEESS